MNLLIDSCANTLASTITPSQSDFYVDWSTYSHEQFKRIFTPEPRRNLIAVAVRSALAWWTT